MHNFRYVVYGGYFVVGIIQLFAIARGFSFALGIPEFVGFLLAFFLTWIPLIGTVAGVYGAIAVWGWWWVWAVFLFAWPYLVGIAYFGAASVIGWQESRRIRRLAEN